MAKEVVLICDIHGDRDNDVRTHTVGLDGKLRELEACEKALSTEPITVLMAAGRVYKGPHFADMPRARVAASRPPAAIEPPPPPPVVPVPPAAPDTAVRASGAAPAATFSPPSPPNGNGSGTTVRPSEIRKWAKAEGLKVSDRGAIPDDIRDKFIAAHS